MPDTAPRSLRKGCAGMALRVGLGRSALGVVLVAASDLGVCAILLGDDPGALRDDLARRFPGATLNDAGEDFSPVVSAVVAMLERPENGLDLPLDPRGTPFQRRVWDALQAIPPGTTTTYAAMADRLGMPGGSRAVARACAANPLAVIVPCHRVIRADGALAGYYWGIARKAALLERERHRTPIAPAESMIAPSQRA